MTDYTLILCRIAQRGVSTRTLDAATSAVLNRSWRNLPDGLPDVVRERAALYGGNVAMAAADVLEAMWAVHGVDMTLKQYVAMWEAIGELDDN